jgi:hypothetical protein
MVAPVLSIGQSSKKAARRVDSAPSRSSWE